MQFNCPLSKSHSFSACIPVRPPLLWVLLFINTFSNVIMMLLRNWMIYVFQHQTIASQLLYYRILSYLKDINLLPKIWKKICINSCATIPAHSSSHNIHWKTTCCMDKDKMIGLRCKAQLHTLQILLLSVCLISISFPWHEQSNHKGASPKKQTSKILKNVKSEVGRVISIQTFSLLKIWTFLLKGGMFRIHVQTWFLSEDYYNVYTLGQK